MKEKEDKILPAISILTYTYNGENVLKECFESLFSQDYPLNKIEWIIADGGSKDKTVDLIKSYAKKYPKVIRFYESPTEHTYAGNEGYGMFARKVSNEIVLFLEQGDMLIQKDWLRKMIKILIENGSISAVQSRISTPERGTAVEKYISSTGINDPFAIPYSLNAQITIHPEKFKYNQKEEYYIYQIDNENFLYAGGGGFMIRKKAFFENGGWIQDTDLFYRMGMNHCNIAVPKNLRLKKRICPDLRKFLEIRGFRVQYYLSKNYYGRDFYWFDLEKNSTKQNLKFINTVIANLVFFPSLIVGIGMAIKKRKLFWLIHPVMQFLITWSYVLVKLYVMIKTKPEEFY